MSLREYRRKRDFSVTGGTRGQNRPSGLESNACSSSSIISPPTITMISASSWTACSKSWAVPRDPAPRPANEGWRLKWKTIRSIMPDSKAKFLKVSTALAPSAGGTTAPGNPKRIRSRASNEGNSNSGYEGESSRDAGPWCGCGPRTGSQTGSLIKSGDP